MLGSVTSPAPAPPASPAASTLAPPDITIRPATAQEMHEMIVPAWIASYSHRLLAKWMRADSTYGLGRTIYWNAVNGKIQRLKQTPGVVFLVALVDGLFAGWACED